MIKPFREYFMTDICKEVIHIKHILFWILFAFEYQMVVIVESMHNTNPHSYDLFVVSIVFHIVYYAYMWKFNVLIWIFDE